MVNSCLVAGANGHLGNNLVRILHGKGENVRASVRNVDYTEPFEGLDCEVVYADILDRESLSNISKFNGKPPAMTRSIVKSYYGTDQSCNISKARRELGYNPVSPYDAFKEALFYLVNKED